MVQESTSARRNMVCPPLRKVRIAGSPFSGRVLTIAQALSTPVMAPTEEVGPNTFPAELQKLAIATRREAETPERWMCIVVRREVITKAVGRVVCIQRVGFVFPGIWIIINAQILPIEPA
ncbi:hypothetical protein BDZ94DRAFT_1261223 [Collybia nuda]|uniref:Uncharacterized protein n=1 Tax=Collybia nuda TaxID=64659 RepID=A0A9P5Y2S4_9AGAR|nr:hypothetical protein BDZ94DRAFT_1261223 [Collybia nuda]